MPTVNFINSVPVFLPANKCIRQVIQFVESTIWIRALKFRYTKISTLTAWKKSSFILAIDFTRARAQAPFSQFLFDRNVTMFAGIKFICLKIILEKQFSKAIQQASFSFIHFASFTCCFPIYIKYDKSVAVLLFIFQCYKNSSCITISLSNSKICPI